MIFTIRFKRTEEERKEISSRGSWQNKPGRKILRESWREKQILCEITFWPSPALNRWSLYTGEGKESSLTTFSPCSHRPLVGWRDLKQLLTPPPSDYLMMTAYVHQSSRATASQITLRFQEWFGFSKLKHLFTYQPLDSANPQLGHTRDWCKNFR